MHNFLIENFILLSNLFLKESIRKCKYDDDDDFLSYFNSLQHIISFKMYRPIKKKWAIFKNRLDISPYIKLQYKLVCL